MQTIPAVQPQRQVARQQPDDDDYYDVVRLRRQWNDWAAAKDAEGREMVESRHYYHADQWTKDDIRKLRDRGQPIVTSNRIVRKIDAIVGLVERLRQDVKAYPRTPHQDEGAELATATLRYQLDSSDWKSKSTRIARLCAIDGIAGLEYDLVPGDEGDPTLEMHIVYADGFFYDPRSWDEGFTDARYMGVAKWIDVDQAKELFPDKAAEIDSLVMSGTDLTSINDSDREKNWVNSNERKVRLADHWYIKGGKWRWCMHIGNAEMMKGVSPFVDERGKTFPRYRMFSASVDHDGDRYGFIRNLKSPQDEINHRRSKALHLLNTRRVVSEKGAVDDIEVARREWAKPDGWVETNPGLKMEPDQSAVSDFKGQLEMLQESKNEIENFGPNPALIGQGLEDSSGRAISLLQQAGVAELGPYLSAYKNWKIRVYRDIWNIIQRHWKEPRWIRVTDDQNVPQLFQVNQMFDPRTGQVHLDEYGRPAIVNALGALDVDIILDEGPDAVNLQADNMMVLQSLGPQFAQEFPEIAIELAPLSNSVKKPMLDKIRAKQNQPPPPDPKVMALQAKAQLDAQTAQREDARETARTQQDLALQARQQQMDEQKAAMDAQLERMKAANDIEIKRMEAAADIQIERIKAANAARMEQERHEQSMDLAREKAAQQAKQAARQPAA
ncbi:portal protein [Bradyrhizobium manausense]